MQISEILFEITKLCYEKRNLSCDVRHGERSQLFVATFSYIAEEDGLWVELLCVVEVHY